MRRRWGQALLDAALPGPALIELERAVALIRPLAPYTRAYLTDALAVLGWALRAHGRQRSCGAGASRGHPAGPRGRRPQFA